MRVFLLGAAFAVSMSLSAPAWANGAAQMNHGHMHHDMSDMTDVKTEHDAPSHQMAGAFGSYSMTREASGTSWQPQSSPMTGMHMSWGEWNAMAHGNVYGVYSNQGGQRGDNKLFSASMGMLMAQRAIGDNGTLALRSMLSLDPLMGKRGYPLLFAAGETADGIDHLVDRQHPHDLFMEMSVSYSHRLSEKSSAFIYAGLPGEPAFGPSAFMHRVSAGDNPEAPLTHHWLDSTHITFGVLTAGYIWDRVKLEASTFRGREPDQFRYNIETPKLDSYSTRLTFNPDDNWSFQASMAKLESPEQLNPRADEKRVSLSASYNLAFGDTNNWATTVAWGRKIGDGAPRLDGFLLESAVTFDDRHTFFARAERLDEYELFDAPSPLHHQVFKVDKLSVGYIRDFKIAEHVSLGIGGLGSAYAYPSALDAAYGSSPLSYMVFVRLKLI
jgi:hypothetical protein